MSHESDMLRRLEPAIRPGGAPAPKAIARRPVEQQNFQELLNEATDGLLAIEARPLRLSAHALSRLTERGVELADSQMAALADAAHKAELKGARDTLMMLDQLALIVNVPNRTVLTVLPQDRLDDGVITQIDSAVFVHEKHDKTDRSFRFNL